VTITRPAPAPLATPRTVGGVEHAMGMPISLALRGRHTDDDDAAAAWAQVLDELRRVGKVFSSYRMDSHAGRLHRDDIGVTHWTPETAEVLALGEAAERDTNGAFSIRRIDHGGHPVLDPTGVVKGWAVDRAAAALRALPDTDFCLSAGGDLICRTINPDGLPWRIGIEDPTDPRRILAVLPVHTGAVATSGATHRGNQRADARADRAPAAIASVTVVAQSPAWAHIDATAAHAHGYNAANWLRARPGRTALIVWDDGSTIAVRQDHRTTVVS
jgi:thiamine biosynthesis lipoprotein